MNSNNEGFLSNKCGYSLCCNIVEQTSYTNIGGFIFQTKCCDTHKDAMGKMIIALTRLTLTDPILGGIAGDIMDEYINVVNETVKFADEQMPYPSKDEYTSFENSFLPSPPPNDKGFMKSTKEFFTKPILTQEQKDKVLEEVKKLNRQVLKQAKEEKEKEIADRMDVVKE